MNNIIDLKVDKFNHELIEIRRHFHQYPELGLKEYKTSEKIAELLTKWGIENKKVGKTGVLGLIKGNKPGKTIAIRADIDALPIQEKTGVEFESKNKGIMHACGHDGHITICLGAAKVLSEMKNELQGNVKFIFQPAEEGPGGAKILIEEGVLENPKVDAIVGLHIWPEIEKGSIGIINGPIMAAADRFDIKIIGKGGHGAMPHMAIDPILAASQITTALQSLTSREVDPLDSIVLSVCTFHTGDAFNIIPNEVVLSGTTRYHNPKLATMLPKRMEELIFGIAKSMRCDYEFKYTKWYPVTLNDEKFTCFFEKVAKEVIGSENICKLKHPSMGAEDFSFYLNKVPGTFFFLGTKNTENGFNKSLHHPEFTFDEDILPIGVKIFCNTVIKFLNEGFR